MSSESQAKIQTKVNQKLIEQREIENLQFQKNINNEMPMKPEDADRESEKIIIQPEKKISVPPKEPQTLFDMIWWFPEKRQNIDFNALFNLFKSVRKKLEQLYKKNVEQIEKVCNSNNRFLVVSQILGEYAGGTFVYSDPNFFASLIQIYSMMLVSNKLADFLTKLSVPMSIYRVSLKIFAQKNKLEWLKKGEGKEGKACLRFMRRWISINPKTFPRSFANLLGRILGESFRIEEGSADNQKREYDRLTELFRDILQTTRDLLKSNLKLAAESGVLLMIFKKALNAELIAFSMTAQFIEMIIGHMNFPEGRNIVLSSLDLGKAFAIFTNVDSRKDNKTEEKYSNSSIIVELLLRSWSTLSYFIHEKTTLKNFVASLKCKSEKEISTINDKIFSKIISRALKYNKQKMKTSQNNFGYRSNYLNYRSLLALCFFLENTNLFQIYQQRDPKGEILRNIGKLSLMYFPITFEKDKFNKQIILNIRLPSVKNQILLSQHFLNWLSYTNESIISYELQREEFIDELHNLLKIPNTKIKIKERAFLYDLLSKFQQIDSHKSEKLLFQFYKHITEILAQLPWQPQFLSIAKFLSQILEKLSKKDYAKTSSYCFSVVQKMFLEPEEEFYRTLSITILDDMGKYFGNMKELKTLIQAYYKDPNFSFRISRILLHMEFQKNQNQSSAFIQKIFNDGSEELILLAIQMIKCVCIENEEKAQWGIKLICKKLLHHESEEIVRTAVQFCEEIVTNSQNQSTFVAQVMPNQMKNPNMKKRVIYTLLRSHEGAEKVQKNFPDFIQNELELWFRDESVLMKDYSLYLTREAKKYMSEKEFSFINVGTEFETKYRLIYLPWNVEINQKNYIALGSYNNLKERIKLRINPNLKIENNIELGKVQIGKVSPLDSLGSQFITLKKQEILRNYEKNKVKQADSHKCIITKDNITFVLKYEKNMFILQKLVIYIPLSKDIYQPLVYPINFINVFSKTIIGMKYLRENNAIQFCSKLIKKGKDAQLVKGALATMGLLFNSNKLEPLEKIQIYESVVQSFESDSTSDVNEVAVWTLNIIVKDEDFRKRFKDLKASLLLESKYCGWLCYPQFSGPKYDYLDPKIRRFSYCQSKAFQQLYQNLSTLYPGFQHIESILQFQQNEKVDEKNQKQKEKKYKGYEFFKRPKTEEIQNSKNPSLFSQVYEYMAMVNFQLQKIKEINEIYNQYLSSDQFIKDFPSGFQLP